MSRICTQRQTARIFASRPFLLLCAASFALNAANVLSVEVQGGGAGGMRHPVPLHIIRWTDKLKVQPWLDAANAEITENGAKPLSPDCDMTFGMGYLQAWKAARKDICMPGGNSTYTCYQHPGNNNGRNVGSLFCTATNLVLDSEDFLGEVLSRKAEFPTPKKGSARVGCTLANPLPLSRNEVADQHTDKWLYDALAAAPPADVAATCSDPSRTITHPVYFVTRMDPTNAFHHFEEVVNFFSAMWLYDQQELLQQGITIVAFDGKAPGFYLELWRRIAFPYRIRFLRARAYPPGTCFRNVLIASMPHRSLYTHFWPGRPTTCRSVVFTAIMKWAHALLSDVRPEVYSWPDGQHRQNAETLVGRVLWVSRRHFEAAGRATTGWQMQRAIGNDERVIDTLSAAVRDWNAKSCLRDPRNPNCRQLPVYFEFSSMELGDHRWYPDQLTMLSRTNVLVAIHGAGVFNEVWLHPATSAAVEITHNSRHNYHYHNIAAFLGLPYYELYSADDMVALSAKMAEVLDSTATRMHNDRLKREAEVAAAAAAEAGGGADGGVGARDLVAGIV